MSIKKTALVAAIITTLTGCASTGVIKAGGDGYLISKTSLQVGFGAPTAVYAEISQEATEFCGKQSKNLDIVNTQIKLPALGSPGSATLEFRCKTKDQ